MRLFPRSALLLTVLLSAALLPPCALAGLPAGSPLIARDQCHRIPTGPGPEDMALLPGDNVRILISSHDRRHFEKAGDIYLYTPADGGMHVLPRHGDPAGLTFRPHGIALARRNGIDLLYVVEHRDPVPNSNNHSVLVYEVRNDGLYFREQLQDERLTSPDGISVAPDGDVYVTNNRKDGTSVLELAMHRSRAYVLVYHQGTWKIAAGDLTYPNGVYAEKDRVMVSLTFGDALLEYPRQPDGTLGKPVQITDKVNEDNIMPGLEPDTYLVSSHTSFYDFMKHKNSSANRSGNIVYEVNVKTRIATPFFVDDGSLISAVSTALIAGKMLYLSQDFDDFLVGCPIRSP